MENKEEIDDVYKERDKLREENKKLRECAEQQIDLLQTSLNNIIQRFEEIYK